jgi:hypothetical protein
MSDQEPTDFDAAKSAIARDEAIERVEKHAAERWKVAALGAVRSVAARRPLFASDEVWRQIPDDAGKPHEPRAMGAVMRRAVREGWIEPTDDFKPTARVAAHRRPQRIWRSNLLDPSEYGGREG